MSRISISDAIRADTRRAGSGQVRWRPRTVRGRHGPVKTREYRPAVERPGSELVVWIHGGGFVTGSLWMPESHAVSTALARTGRVVVAVDYRKVPLLPVKTREYRPAVERPGSELVVWIHGGGFVTGSLWMPESHAVSTALARTGRVVVAVDYRKVPLLPVLIPAMPIRPSKNAYPVAVEDVLDAYLDVRERYPEHRVVVGGASAGAHLAASAALRAADQPPAALLLAYGAFHAELPPFSAELAQTLAASTARLRFTPEVTRRYALNYAGSEDVLRDLAASPGTAPVDALPPAFFLNADHDTLRSSAEAYAVRIRAAGKPVTEVRVPRSEHGFLSNVGSAAFREGVARMIAWLDEGSA